jgi:DNA-binding CsgD family transcriptional regulator
MKRQGGPAEVRESIGRLWAQPGTAELVAAATIELCRCGFDRASLTRVVGSEVTMVSAWSTRDPHASNPGASGAKREARGPDLRPAIGDDGLSAGAPVVLSSRVAGYFQVDCHAGRRSLNEHDLDVVVTFAQGFAHAYERSVLRDRLRALRTDARRVSAGLVASADGALDAAIELSARTTAEQDINLEELLTRREMEVFRLVAAGKTNAAIAEQLVVSIGTVKSHVKHILHKLQAKNRAEAVSLYIRRW